jgi:hypothetical protein
VGLHQGIEGSRMFLNYAVFEDTAAFAATTRQPEFGPLRAVYPDSATPICIWTRSSH